MAFPKYDSYQDSGVEWLGEIPSHWDIRRIKSYALVKRGASPRPISDPRYFNDEGEYGWVRIEDVTKSNKYLLETKQYLSELGNSYSVKQHEGDLFLSIAGSVGKPIISKIKCCIHDGFVWFNWVNKINREYLFYIFVSGLPFIGLGKHGTQLNLNTSTIGDIRIPAPSLEEQDRIVRFLDRKTSEIDQAIAKKQRLIELLQEQKAILINQAVTKGLNPNVPMQDSGIEWIGEIPKHWKIRRLRRVVKKFVDYRGKTPPVSESGIPLITASAIRNGKIDHSRKPGYVTEKIYSEWMVRGFPNKGDVVFTTEGATFGETGQIVDERIALAQRLILFKTDKEKLTNDYLFFYLISAGQSEMQSNVNGTTVFGISSADLKATRIPVPPLEEQISLTEHLKSRIDGYEEAYQLIERQIEKLKESRNILISNVVTGKLKV